MIPRVSVICAFLNAESFLDETVASVLAQDYQDFELLLVDDGSTDGSTAIAKGYAAGDSPIRYLEHPDHKNRGTCASRNLGLQESRSEFVAFIDADDCWRVSKLGEQVELLDGMPEVDAVCGAVNFWGSHRGGADEVIRTGHVFNQPVRPFDALLKLYPLGKADPPCPSDLLTRRSIIESIGGFEEAFTGPLQLYEDQAFLLKFFLEGTIYFSDRVWLDYRLHDQSCTARVVREGLGPEVRGYCLEWFETYLAGTPHRNNPAIRWALLRALRPYRHPHISKLGRMAKAMLGRSAESPVSA